MRACVRGLKRAATRASSVARAPRARAHARRARRLLWQIEIMRLDPENVGLKFQSLMKKLFETGNVERYMEAFFPGVIDAREVRRPTAQLFLAG